MASVLLLLVLLLLGRGGPRATSSVSLLVVPPVLAVGTAAATVVDTNSCQLSDAELQIEQYLQKVRQSQSSSSKNNKNKKFHVQGWRWHTMSLIRESRRLEQLAHKLLLQSSSNDDDATTSQSALSVLENAAEYTVKFNMKGLHSIEKDLFFPWVRTKTRNYAMLNDDENKNKDDDDDDVVIRAFDTIMDQLENDRQRIEDLGAALIQDVSIATKAAATDVREEKMVLLRNVAAKASAIAESAASMLQREEMTLVPAIAQFVPESEQKSFNNKVIRKLGILDSRLHLVGMHEAVWDLNDVSERQLFKETIPSIPQMMIPRWKRLMYEPRAGALDKMSVP